VVIEQSKYGELANLLAGTNTKAMAGDSGLAEVLAAEYDLVISAIVGAQGLGATFKAIKQTKVLAIANKESLVCAGEFILAEALKHNTKILPVDSEHSALLQVLQFENSNNLSSITITASGGAFRDWPKSAISHASKTDALKHPNWSMGAKITIDSATLANKALEVIEAIQLFAIAKSQIKVICHYESIIHAMASYKDGTTLAHMGLPDMKTPIAYAMTYPERIETTVGELDLIKLGKLNFSAIDFDRFPMLKLGLDICDQSPKIRTIYNVANEIAVNRFLAGSCGFYDINRLVENALNIEHKLDVNSISDCQEFINYLVELYSNQ
jgi:1-deoxy-D-xylulose-5-phosphate reductoisomerase